MSQLSISLSDEIDLKTPWLQLETIVNDRGSRYSVTAGRVQNKEEIKAFLKKLKKDKKYLKATHNTYACRLRKDTQLVEVKSDDGETGAGMIVLRMIRKANMVNVIVVVTRWYGGVKLHADRFKHVQDASIVILNEIASK
jgi:putative IMPACT (imprinted ancient) family translation regulator